MGNLIKWIIKLHRPDTCRGWRHLRIVGTCFSPLTECLNMAPPPLPYVIIWHLAPPSLCLAQIPHPANCSTQRGSLPSDDIHPLHIILTHVLIWRIGVRESCGFQNGWIFGKVKGRLKLFWKFIHISIYRLLLGMTWDKALSKYLHCPEVEGPRGGCQNILGDLSSKIDNPPPPPKKKNDASHIYALFVVKSTRLWQSDRIAGEGAKPILKVPVSQANLCSPNKLFQFKTLPTHWLTDLMVWYYDGTTALIFRIVSMMRKITLTMKIEFDLNRPVEWQFHPAALDKGSNFWRSTAVHRDSGLSFVQRRSWRGGGGSRDLFWK